jgi:hypothetical protein
VPDFIRAVYFPPGGAAARDRIYLCLAHRLREDGVTAASVEELLRQGDKVLDRFGSLKDIIDRGDFRSFLVKWYAFPKAPPNERLLDWSARSLRIFSRMIDDQPGGKGGRIAKRISTTLRTLGVLLSGLLRIVLPRSLPRDTLLHGLRFFLGVGVVFIVGGVLLGFFAGTETGDTAEGIRNIGFAVVAACFVIWLLVTLATRVVTGRTGLPTALMTLVALVIAGLAVFGGYKAWELAQGALAAF